MDLLDHSGEATSPCAPGLARSRSDRAHGTATDPAACLRALADATAVPLAALRRHRVWHLAARPEALRLLMEHHVYCVWDFMSLVKALQAQLTCVATPWVPRGTPALRRFVNEIVLDEESDQVADESTSHFELYLRAMAAMQADPARACAFVAAVADGDEPAVALRRCEVPGPAAAFVTQTLDVVARGRVWEIAAAFTFGREEAIPAMFAELVASLPGRGRCAGGSRYDSSALRVYLERHIDVDGGKHAPLARRLMIEVCGDDAQRWRDARAAALSALAARHALWDAVAARIDRL